MPELIEFKFAPLSERLPPGTARRLFFATDEGVGYSDDGNDWQRFSGNLYAEVTALEWLPAMCMVNADGTRAVDGDIPLGMTLTGGHRGDTVKVFTEGILANPAWYWTPGATLYLDQAGALTETETTTRAGVALTYRTMALQPACVNFDPDKILTNDGEVLVNGGNVLCNFR